MLKRSLPLFLAAISVTQIATEMGSPYVQQLPYQNYNNKNMPSPREKVELKVYYESHCPGCRDLHKTSLDPLLLELGSYLNFKSYPYGNAKTVQENGRTWVKCQHGAMENYGNKLHACAIDQRRGPVWAELFNTCMMSCHWGGQGSTDMDAINCGTTMGIDARPIIRCARSQRGEDLLEYYGRETALVNKTYVPFVLINGNEFEGQCADLKAAVCQAFTNPPPPCLQ